MEIYTVNKGGSGGFDTESLGRITKPVDPQG